MKFLRNEHIESLAEKRLLELERAMSRPLSLPIPIDLLGEQILGLQFLWDSIDELEGELILGAIMPTERLIVLNERRKSMFDEKPGLERSTKGHEMGHWDLFIDKGTLRHPELFDTDKFNSPIAYRSSPRGEVAILKMLHTTAEGQEFLRKMNARADAPDEARAVNRYAAAISMPRAMLREEAQRIDRTKWSDLYKLREKFDVTISALVVRMQQLDLLFVRNGQPFESRDAAVGQLTLGL